MQADANTHASGQPGNNQHASGQPGNNSKLDDTSSLSLSLSLSLSQVKSSHQEWMIKSSQVVGSSRMEWGRAMTNTVTKLDHSKAKQRKAATKERQHIAKKGKSTWQQPVTTNMQADNLDTTNMQADANTHASGQHGKNQHASRLNRPNLFKAGTHPSHPSTNPRFELSEVYHPCADPCQHTTYCEAKRQLTWQLL